MLVINPAEPSFFFNLKLMYENLFDKLKAEKPAFVAVYGTLKRGQSNHRCLGDSVFIGTSRIPGFKMYSLGGFPGVVTGDASILIEVFQVTNDKDAQRVYSLEGYNGVRGHARNTFYDTVDIEVNINGEDLKAEMFIFKGRYLGPLVESGEW